MTSMRAFRPTALLRPGASLIQFVGTAGVRA
jgi:hypothetical protein